VKTPFEHSANVALGFEKAMRDVSVSTRYALSVFTLEVNGKPTLVFRTKWHIEAERIGRDWVYSHQDQILMKGPFGTKLPPLIKVRIARAAEREAFEADTDSLDIYDGVKVVRLIDGNEIRDGNRESGAIGSNDS
jgi:hypothetical protein